MTDTQMFDPAKIILNKTKEKNDFYKILYNNKRLSLELEDIIIPFGIDYDKYSTYVPIELDQEEAIEFIKNIEFAIENRTREILNNDELKVKSQVRFSKYGWIVKTKIPKSKFGLSIDCYDKDNRRFSIYDLNENIDGCDVLLYISYIWIKDNDIFYKWNIKKIKL